MEKPSRRTMLQMMPAAALLIAAAREETDDVTPTEDLMREHGLLKRVLLIYDEVARRIDANQPFPRDAVVNSAKILRSFIHGYHERLEEQYLFPRFRKHNKLVDLVDVLEQQHTAGRRVTETIIATADKKVLQGALRSFVRMYAPHEAREDTVLFPALHDIVSKHEYDALGDDFEKKEHELFGKEGFEGMVPRVAAIEKELGIYDLAQFTPR